MRFRKVNKDIFEAIRRSKKKVETLAATVKYRNIRTGDRIIFICGRSRFEKKVKRATVFKSIPAMLKKYKIKDIMPKLSSADELKEVYFSYPKYREKIRRFGIIALELR